MADVQLDPLSEALELAATRKEQLHKAFTELEARKFQIGNASLSWKELQEHFADIEKIVKRQIDELREKELAFEVKSKKLQQEYNEKEKAVVEKEQASLGRIQEQKDLAIALIFEEKLKWSEEKQALKAAGVTVIPDQKVGSEEAIADANRSVAQTTVANSLLVSTTDTVLADVSTQPSTNNQGKFDVSYKVSLSNVKVTPELKSLCEDMDAEGLTKYVTEHKKDIVTLRSEIPAALQFAIDPSRLILRALEGYRLSEHRSGQAIDKDGVSLGIRRACVLLLESLAVVLADPLSGVDHIVVPSNIRLSAKEVADTWKSKMDFQINAAMSNPLDSQAFLQLLATFGIASEYNADELCNLVLAVARRKQTPALCKSLGLAPKIPDLVDKLSKEGKVIEALSFAHTFGIMDTILPVPLLKGYLKEVRKTAQSIVKKGNNSPAAQNDSSMKELSALKAVLRCIEEYKLEPQYPSAPLQRRVTQLEKAKSDRKRAAVVVKAQAKRPRPSGTGVGPVVSPNEKGILKTSERRQYTAGAGISSYNMAPQSAYDNILSATYASTYGGVRSSGSSYLYPSDVIAPSVYGSAVYTNPPPSYSSYQFGGGLPPPPPAYQTSFLH